MTTAYPDVSGWGVALTLSTGVCHHAHFVAAARSILSSAAMGSGHTTLTTALTAHRHELTRNNGRRLHPDGCEPAVEPQSDRPRALRRPATPPRDHQTPHFPRGRQTRQQCQDERDSPLQWRQGEERRGEERHDDPTGEQRGEDDEERQVTGGESTAFVLCHSGKAIYRSAWPTHERNVVGAGRPALATTAHDHAGTA